MQPENACPGRDQLLALLRGQLDGEALEAVCQHLGVCANCDAQLAPLEEAEGGIVANLRRFHNREPGIDREEIKALEVKVKAISLEQLETPPLASSSADDAAATPPDQAHLTRLGKYRLLQELGKGGMGIVYAALHTNLNRKVAVKVIRPEHSGDSQMRARFKREMEAVGALVHPNIVAATDADEAEGHPFLVMELVDGLNLDALLRLSGPLPVAEACDIIRQAALGLQYVHEHQRVHRDLKPSNLMLSTDGVVKILDLGLARLFSDENGSGGLTASNLVMGTEDYMAPEQWKDSHNADIRADIYSLGCTGYKLLVGKAPFSDPEYKPRRKKKLAHALLPYPPVQSCRSDVPAGLAKVLERMLEKEPAARFATPQEVAVALKPFAEGCDCGQLVAAALQRSAELPQGQEGIKGAAPETVAHKPNTPLLAALSNVGGRASRFIRKRRRELIGSAAVVASLSVAVAFFGDWWRHNKVPEPSAEVGHTLAPRGKVPEPVPAAELAMETGKWYPRLHREPAKLVWENPGRYDFGLFSPDLTEVVKASSLSLLSLGPIDRASYRIQLGIKQSPWVGGVGLFFGYHLEKGMPIPRFKFQYLEVRPDYKGGLILTRNWAIVERAPLGVLSTLAPSSAGLMGSPSAAGPLDAASALFAGRSPLGLHMRESWGFANGKLDRPRPNEISAEESLLVIEVIKNRLTQVIWNHTLLPDLIGTERIGRVNDGDFVGEFGMFNRKSQSVFGKAHLMLLD